MTHTLQDMFLKIGGIEPAGLEGKLQYYLSEPFKASSYFMTIL